MTLIRDNFTWEIQLFFPRDIFWMQLWSFRQDPANYINLRLQIFSTHSTRRPIWTHNTLGWTNKEIWSTTFLLYFTSSQVIYLYFCYEYWFRAFHFMLLSPCFSLAFLLLHPLSYYTRSFIIFNLIWMKGNKTRYKNIESWEGPCFHRQHDCCWNCWFQNYCYRRISKRFVQTQNQKFHCSLKKGINKSDSLTYSCFF